MRPALLSGIAVVLAVCAFQLWISPGNPPGFFRDEAALAYNAYSIEQSGRDEYGARFPLYFSSFLDFKSPIFVYALASVFRVTGPDREVARGLAAASILVAVLLLGWLGYRLSGRTAVGVAAAAVAGFCPWFFELGRVALEVSMEPLLLATVLLGVERAARLDDWRARGALPVALALGAITYVYAGGRFLAPLLAASLLVLANRSRRGWVATAIGGFAVTQIPLLLYAHAHPGALSRRFDATTFIHEGVSWFEILWRTGFNYVQDIQLWHYIVSGDSKPYAHTPGASALLAGSVALSVAGLVLVLRHHRDDAFWRYALAALVVSPLPAAITIDRFHALRLAPFAVMLVVFAIPSIEALMRRSHRRVLGIAVAVAGAVQLLVFVHDYSTDGPLRGGRFEAGIPDLLAQGWKNGGTVYVDYDDLEPLTLARWYALDHGISQQRVVRLPDGGIPPTGAIAFGRTQECDYSCTRIGRYGDYWIARVEGG
jgi:4-amino-4-deoxy-L-arabinose transferase-like glycosyltransferase